MKSITLSAFCLFSVAINAQVNTSEAVSIKPKSELKKGSITQQPISTTASGQSNGKYYSEYIVYPEKLKTYFISGEIPADFPKYDKSKTHEENKQIARQWGKNNKHLIKDQFLHLVEEK